MTQSSNEEMRRAMQAALDWLSQPVQYTPVGKLSILRLWPSHKNAMCQVNILREDCRMARLEISRALAKLSLNI